MSAICGMVHFDGRPLDADALAAMRDVMAHRGPDHSGQWVRGLAGLGQCQLKVLELSPAADLPMSNEDGTLWLVCDGSIYNHQELAAELKATGHRFRSGSDAEVVLHGYEEWGEAVVERLDGMFALGLWDSARQRLLLARDRFGKKPLYCLAQGATVMFASDLKAFRAVSGVKLTLNPAALDCYLHHLATTQEQCIYREVRKIKPAHWETFAVRGSRQNRYWLPPFGHKVALRQEEWIERVEAALRSAIRRRLAGSVAFGAFLSGGVNSSLMVALMSQMGSRPVRTFAVGFGDRDYDELDHARRVAALHGTDHHEIILKPDFLRDLPALIWEFGEPFGDPTALPASCAARAVRPSIAVALSGDGGDDMFGGYGVARAAWAAWQYDRWTPKPVRPSLDRFLVHGRAPRSSKWLHKLKTLAVHASPDPAVRHGFTTAFGPEDKAALYRPAFREVLPGDPAREVFEVWRESAAALHPIDQHLFMTFVTRLPNDYLVKLDVVSMKVAMELRTPYLDATLAELAGAIDPLAKIRMGRQKYLLKKLAERHLPETVVHRKKRGFVLPLEAWLRREWSPLLRRLLPQGSLARTGWFDAAAMSRLIEEHAAGAANHTQRLWALLWLELWFRMFVEGTLRPEDSLTA